MCLSGLFLGTASSQGNIERFLVLSYKAQCALDLLLFNVYQFGVRLNLLQSDEYGINPF